jgi:SAM-dependent methyltransferase
MYTPELFAAWREPSANAARAVVPTIAAIVKPASVIDIGCGTGSWLAAFGLDDVLGVDAYVPDEALEIPPERFVRTDLTSVFSAGRSFDLALSVEVGEHLPVEAAPLLVQTLVGHSPAVVFSAAIPGQAGTGHVNGQWPDWWAGLFAEHGYQPCDCLRLRFWDNPQVPYYYAQNLILYARDLSQFGLEATPTPRLVHPELYDYARSSAMM